MIYTVRFAQRIGTTKRAKVFTRKSYVENLDEARGLARDLKKDASVVGDIVIVREEVIETIHNL